MQPFYVPDSFSFNLIEQISITLNPATRKSELIVLGSFTAAHFGTWPTLDDTMEAIKQFRFHCPNAKIEINDSEFFDNTCRCRSCVWNENDTCSLRQQYTIMPTPSEPDLTKTEWTSENSILPTICPEYEIKEVPPYGNN